MKFKYEIIDIINAFNDICRKYNLQDLELLNYYKKKELGIKNVTIYQIRKELNEALKDKVNKEFIIKKKGRKEIKSIKLFF